MKLQDLNGKKVAIWGAGREATTLCRAIKLRGVQADIAIYDESGNDSQPISNITPTSDFSAVENADVVVLSPGVSRYRAEVMSLSPKLTSATDLFFGEGYEHVIGVTGTKGKSTTSALIAHLLAATGLTTQLAGNIGRSPIDYVNDGDPPDWWVLELSSFQTSSLNDSPQIGVFTTLSPEHLDWHGSFERYRTDKLNMFAHKPNMTSVVNVDDPTLSQLADRLPNPIKVGANQEQSSPGGVVVKNGSFYVDGKELFSTDALRLLGRHNKKLACLALSAVGATGVDLHALRTTIANALFAFEPLAHRLSPIATINGVSYVDDGLATTPIAAMAALDAFDTQRITILLGGYDRGASYKDLCAMIGGLEHVQVITMPANGPQIGALLVETNPDAKDRLHEATSLEDAVKKAAEITPEGGVVLLSPAAASFGAFRDYVERSEAFTRYVLQLSE